MRRGHARRVKSASGSPSRSPLCCRFYHLLTLVSPSPHPRRVSLRVRGALPASTRSSTWRAYCALHPQHRRRQGSCFGTLTSRSTIVPRSSRPTSNHGRSDAIHVTPALRLNLVQASLQRCVYRNYLCLFRPHGYPARHYIVTGDRSTVYYGRAAHSARS